MKKINKLSIFLFLALLGFSPRAFSYALATFSDPEMAQEICSYISETTKTKSEIESTNDLIKKGVLEGIPGYLSAIKSGDWSGLLKGMATQGYDIYKKDAENKKKAKLLAQNEADEKAKEKLEAQEEGTMAAVEAVDENREAAAENRKEKVKKKFSWFKKQGEKAGAWLNKGKNKQGVNGAVGIIFGSDSQISSTVNKATDSLSKQGQSSGTDNNEGAANNGGADNSDNKSKS